MILRRLYSASSIQAGSRIISGIQPTGIPHIGNYLGFIEQFVRVQNDHSSSQKFLFLADYHSISVGLPEIGQLDRNVREMTTCLLACGVDPAKTVLFVQSRILEHTELAWILSSMQSIARLERLTQFKDKAGLYSNNKVPLGLVNYPVLQAADVLLYKGTHVPVGEDQTQHFNLIGSFAKRLNNFIKDEFFPSPTMLTSHYPRIKSLRNPAQKMSKSDKSQIGCVFITDSSETVQEKVRKSFTDSLGTIEYDPVERKGVSNLLQILSAFTNRSIEQTVDECQSLDTLGLKERTADAINAHFEPIRKEYSRIIEDQSFIADVLSKGETKAREFACDTMQTLKQRLGFYTGK